MVDRHLEVRVVRVVVLALDRERADPYSETSAAATSSWVERVRGTEDDIGAATGVRMSSPSRW
jgi:hypothetical protein